MADPQTPIRIASVLSDVEAAAIITALGSHNVEARATGGFTSGFRAEAPGEIGIVVRQCDVQRAQEALATIRREQGEFDWSDVDVGLPEEE